MIIKAVLKLLLHQMKNMKLTPCLRNQNKIVGQIMIIMKKKLNTHMTFKTDLHMENLKINRYVFVYWRGLIIQVLNKKC